MHMKTILMFILMYQVLKIMENYLIKMLMNFLQERELKYRKIKKDLKILFYGNLLLMENQDGILPGAEVDQAGI